MTTTAINNTGLMEEDNFIKEARYDIARDRAEQRDGAYSLSLEELLAKGLEQGLTNDDDWIDPVTKERQQHLDRLANVSFYKSLGWKDDKGVSFRESVLKILPFFATSEELAAYKTKMSLIKLSSSRRPFLFTPKASLPFSIILTAPVVCCDIVIL